MTSRRQRYVSRQRTDFSSGFSGFQEFCSRLQLDAQPFGLHPAHQRLFRAHFAGRREIVAIMPVGNGKSTVLAARGLHHMLTVSRAECIIAASTAHQAATIFDQMAALTIESELPLDVKRGIHAIYHKGTGPNRKPLGRIRVISADTKGNAGGIPTLVLIDELWAHKDGRLYNMFQNRLSKKNAQMLTISNAGWEEESFLAGIRLRAHEHESFKRRGMVSHAAMGPMEFFEWCLDDKDNPDHLPTVLKANPLLTLEALEERKSSPGLMRSEWLRNTCGIWTTAEDAWLKPEDWDPLEVDLGAVREGETVWVAVRYGQQGGCGIGIAAARGDGVAVKTETLPYDFANVQFRLRRLCQQYDVRAINIDVRHFGGESVAESILGDLPIKNNVQTPVRLVEATSTFLRLVGSGTLYHDGDRVLRTQVLAGRVKETTTGAYLEPEAEYNALVALVMAVAQVVEHAGDRPPKIHVYRSA